MGLKSAEISETENITAEATDIKTAGAKIKIYPNPFADKITLDYSGDIFPLEYKITDLSGKEILHKKTSAGIEIIDLNGLAAGTYVVSAKAGDYNLVQKLVKK